MTAKKGAYLSPGALSNDNKEFIRQNSTKMSVEEIAVMIGKRVGSVQKFIDKNHLGTFNDRPDDDQREILRRKLQAKYWFPNMRRQLVTEEEREIFMNKWVDFMIQFKEDVLASEEEQIKELILLSIAVERVRITEADNLATIDVLKRRVEKEYNKDPMMRDPELAIWEAKLDGAIAASSAYTKQIKDMNHDLLNLNKDLKGTRDQRFKQIDSGDKTFLGLIRKLQDDAQRERLSREAELMRLATEKKREELGRWHEYSDGQVDIPILTTDTAKFMREFDQKTEETSEERS